MLNEVLTWNLQKIKAGNFFELIYKCRKKSSTIFCLQFREEERWAQICGGDIILANANMDCIFCDSYKINTESTNLFKDISMSKIYGGDPKKAK